ncbi:MAG TPA: carboxypeptidase-like regulatory domain-containing protein, partial [Terriglobia bacterium]|nr:carboxypeptidase-like regulatory domain-containing protein [Terriglobia bacterium]
MKMLLLTLILFAQRPPSTALQTGAVTGRLLNEDGTPAVKVRVSAMSIPDTQGGNLSPALITLTETDNTGRYRLADVPVGRYYVVAGFVDSPTYYPRGTSPSGATPVNVTFNATAANIDFRIERPSTGLTVSGRVISEASSAFGIQINLTGNSNGSFSNANVAAKLDGSFEFVRVRPGTYNLSVNPSPFPDQRSIVVVDKDVTGLELRIPWTGEVTGRVVVDGGGPSPAVTGLFSGGGRFVNTYIGPNQTFRAMLPEGFFAFTASTLPAGFYIKSVTSGKTDLLTTPISVSKTGLPQEVLVTLGATTPSPWVRLSGRITGAGTASALSITLNGN